MEFADIHLMLDGPDGVVNGDSRAKGADNQIELWDWAWGLRMEDRPTDSGAQTDRAAKADTIKITKPVDRASTAMMSILHRGDNCAKAVLSMKQSTSKKIDLQLELKNVRLEEYTLKMECSDLEVELSEDWTLAYEEVRVLYQSPQLAGPATFSLRMKPGGKQDSPEPQESSASRKAAESMDRDDMIKLIDERLKKLGLIK